MQLGNMIEKNQKPNIHLNAVCGFFFFFFNKKNRLPVINDFGK